MELVPIKNMPKDIKIKLLKELGFNSDGKFVIDSQGNRIKDKYLDIEIEISNMLLFPGSTTILDNNPLSIALYLEEHNNVF